MSVDDFSANQSVDVATTSLAYKNQYRTAIFATDHRHSLYKTKLFNSIHRSTSMIAILTSTYCKINLLQRKIFLQRDYYSLVLCLLISAQAAPHVGTIGDLATKVESSEIFEQTTAERSFENYTIANLNGSASSTMTTTMMIIPNSTITNVVIAGRVGNARSANSTASQSSAGSQLSGGAIAGIVIGVLVLLCCLALCGCCKQSGHWEDAKVWVKD